MQLHPAGRRDKQGRLLCRRCSKPVPKPRRAWCSEECIRESWWETRAPFRERIGRRDNGVCSDCGLDTKRIERIIDKLSKRARRPWGRAETDDEFEKRIIATTRLVAFVRKLEGSGWSGCFGYSMGVPGVLKSLWEADHIKPRVLGGADATENGRTLCVPCHKAATKRLARYRKHRRRGRMQLFPETFS